MDFSNKRQEFTEFLSLNITLEMLSYFYLANSDIELLLIFLVLDY